jgi:hypothetical protein
MVNNRIKYIILFAAVLFCVNSYSQVSQPNPLIEWTTWTLLQVIPSPTFYQDNNENISKLIIGIKWQITPLAYSFNMNKYVRKVHFFKVNPLHRHSGSIELFFQPEFALKPYLYSGQRRFSLTTGSRVFLPLIEYGEYLSFSAGLKYSIRNNIDGTDMNSFGIEGGVYSIFGIAGLQFTYNLTVTNRYNLSVYIKYY